ncbi:hypothetical protein TPA0908_10530 [Micromonospora sp. AKA38]|nr:hypothetical protein TPA0908_10530 [Micromonospora sp. AKA38]
MGQSEGRHSVGGQDPQVVVRVIGLPDPAQAPRTPAGDRALLIPDAPETGIRFGNVPSLG